MASSRTKRKRYRAWLHRQCFEGDLSQSADALGVANSQRVLGSSRADPVERQAEMKIIAEAKHQAGGIFGGGPTRPGRWNLHLIRRAIRDGWLEDAPQEKKDAIIRHLGEVGIFCGRNLKGRGYVAAARALLAAITAMIDAEQFNICQEYIASGLKPPSRRQRQPALSGDSMQQLLDLVAQMEGADYA